MKLRVSGVSAGGLKVGVLAGLLAISTAGCKQGPFKPMPKENVSEKTAKVLDSCYKDGLWVQNSPEYKLAYNDTVIYHEWYTESPKTIQDYFNRRIYDDTHYYDEYGSYEAENPKNIKYIVSSNQLYTNDSIKSYMAIAKYRKVKQ